MLRESDWKAIVKFFSNRDIVKSFVEPREKFKLFYEVYTASLDGNNLVVKSVVVNDQGEDRDYTIVFNKPLRITNYFRPLVRISAKSWHRDPLMMVSVAEDGRGFELFIINSTDRTNFFHYTIPKPNRYDVFLMDDFLQLRYSMVHDECSWTAITGGSWFRACDYIFYHYLYHSAPPKNVYNWDFLNFGVMYYAEKATQGMDKEYLHHAYGLLPDGPFLVYGGSQMTGDSSCKLQSYYEITILERNTCSDEPYKITMAKTDNETYRSSWHDVHSLIVKADQTDRRNDLDFGAAGMVRYIQRFEDTAQHRMAIDFQEEMENSHNSFSMAIPPEPFMPLIFTMVIFWIVNMLVLALFFVYMKDNVDKLHAINQKLNRRRRMKSMVARIIKKKKLKGKALNTAMTNLKNNTKTKKRSLNMEAPDSENTAAETESMKLPTTETTQNDTDGATKTKKSKSQ